MKRSALYRVLGIVGAVGIVGLAVLYFLRPAAPRARHGVRVVYSIDLDRVIDDETQERAYRIGAILDDAGISASPSADTAPGAFVVHVPDPTKAERLRQVFEKAYRGELVVRACDPPDASKVCAQLAPTVAATVRRDALKETVAILRVRLDNAGVAASVSEQGGQLVVELPGVDDDTAGSVRALLGRNASLEFRLVAHDTSVARALHRHVGPVDAPRDPEAQRLGIKAYTDSWRPDRKHKDEEDYFLTAHDREASGRQVLERYLQAAAQANVSFELSDDHEFGFQYVEPWTDAEDPQPYWRTYCLERAVRLDSRAVADVEVRHDPTFGRPEVFVVFTSHGRQVFAELTAASIGRKLAIVLDGRVVTAPIIQGEMRIGRVTISVGGNSTKEQEADAVALRDVLRAGMLPAPLREESVSRWGSP